MMGGRSAAGSIPLCEAGPDAAGAVPAREAGPDAAVVFVGHGTRSEAGCRMFLETVRLAREMGTGWPPVVETAYLELREPGVPAVLASLHARGVRRVDLVPVLLFAAGHHKMDLPAQVRSVTQGHPDLVVRIGPVLGADPRLAALAARRAQEAAGSLRPEDALLVVGRGNRDACARRTFLDVAEAIRRRCGVARESFATGVLAGDGDPLEEAAVRLLQRRPQRVVVVPYLLFDGYLTRTLPERLRSVDAAVPWVVAGPLGADPVVARVLAERAGVAMGYGGRPIPSGRSAV